MDVRALGPFFADAAELVAAEFSPPAVVRVFKSRGANKESHSHQSKAGSTMLKFPMPSSLSNIVEFFLAASPPTSSCQCNRRRQEFLVDMHSLWDRRGPLLGGGGGGGALALTFGFVPSESFGIEHDGICLGGGGLGFGADTDPFGIPFPHVLRCDDELYALLPCAFATCITSGGDSVVRRVLSAVEVGPTTSAPLHSGLVCAREDGTSDTFVRISTTGVTARCLVTGASLPLRPRQRDAGRLSVASRVRDVD